MKSNQTQSAHRNSVPLIETLESRQLMSVSTVNLSTMISNTSSSNAYTINSYNGAPTIATEALWGLKFPG